MKCKCDDLNRIRGNLLFVIIVERNSTDLYADGMVILISQTPIISTKK